MFPKQIETYFQDVIDFETLHNFEVSHFFDPFSDVAKKNNKTARGSACPRYQSDA